jgi:hypothetical protein
MSVRTFAYFDARPAALPPAASWQRATGVFYPRAATGLCRGSFIFNGSVGAVGERALWGPAFSVLVTVQKSTNECAAFVAAGGPF